MIKLATFLLILVSIFFAPNPVIPTQGFLLAIFWMLWHISDILADILKQLSNKSPEDKEDKKEP